MKHNELKNIIKKRFEKLNIAYGNVRLHSSEDGIRIFRVKVKKLQACINLINAEKVKSPPLTLPKKISKLYEVAGAIRNLQIQHQYIHQTLQDKHAALPQTYLNNLTDNIEQQIEAATKLATAKLPFKNAEHQILKALPASLSKKNIKAFAKLQLNKLERLLAPVFPADDSLHSVRKLLKGILYTWPYLEKNVGLISPYAALTTEQDIRLFTVLLGNFHDSISALSLLHTSCYNDNLNEQEKTTLRDIEKHWRKENEVARAKISTHLQKLISSKPLSPANKYQTYQNLTLQLP